MNYAVKKALAILAVIAIIVSISAPVHGAYFGDVSRSSVDSDTLDAINYVSDNDIMYGMSSTQFSPNTQLTRAMFVTILYRYSKSAEQFSNSFTDVPSGTYYYWAVGWAEHYGIVNGVTTTQFVPNGNITREQALAILYRYATEYLGLSYTKTASISGHPDYGNVSNYARSCVSWAKAYNILQIPSSSNYIYPKEKISRGNAALYMARYSFFADKVYVRDKFSFINISSSFYSSSLGKRYIDSFSLNRLYSQINSYYSSFSAKENRDAVTRHLNSPWQGSCHGMSMSFILDKIRKIDFNKNFGNGVMMMSSVHSPINYRPTEGAIAYYQATFQLSRSYPDYTDSRVRTGAVNLVEQVSKNGPTLFNYYYTYSQDGNTSTAGHSIVLLSVTSLGSDRYTFKVMDPNSVNYESRDLFISSTGVTFYGKDLYALSYYTKNEIDFWDYFDLDGTCNDLDQLDPLANGDNEKTRKHNFDIYYKNNSSLLFVPRVPFVIENSFGEQLICDGTSISGSMQIVSTRICPNGPDTPATLQLRVNSSDYFTYSSPYKESSFFVSDPQYFGGASGQNITSISVGADGTVQLHGDDMMYNALVSPQTENAGYLSIRGNGIGSAFLQVAGNTVTTSGMAGPCTISFLRSDGIESLPVSVTLSDYTEIGLPSGQKNAIFSIKNSNDSSANQLISNWVEPGDCQ